MRALPHGDGRDYEGRLVCDGCWRRGLCRAPGTCRCPCRREGWPHADDPSRPHRAERPVGRWQRFWRWLW